MDHDDDECWCGFCGLMMYPPGEICEDCETLQSYFGDACLCCGTKENVWANQVVPASQGGIHGLENLQPLCQTCNAQKGIQAIDYRDPGLLSLFIEVVCAD
jgi:hypothetical protein